MMAKLVPQMRKLLTRSTLELPCPLPGRAWFGACGCSPSSMSHSVMLIQRGLAGIEEDPGQTSMGEGVGEAAGVVGSLASPMGTFSCAMNLLDS